jgi:hypothetical protein
VQKYKRTENFHLLKHKMETVLEAKEVTYLIRTFMAMLEACSPSHHFIFALYKYLLTYELY